VFGELNLDKGCRGDCREAVAVGTNHFYVTWQQRGQRPDKGKTPGACVVNNKIFLQHICRSATLAGWGELYGRTGYNYIFSGEWGAVCHYLPGEAGQCWDSDLHVRTSSSWELMQSSSMDLLVLGPA